MSQNLSRLFSGIKNPIEAQTLYYTWKLGSVVEVNRLRPSQLGVALLVATVALRAFGTEVVDDYNALYDLVKEEYEQTDRGPRFWHPDGHVISMLVYNYGPHGDFEMLEWPDAQYIHPAVQELFGL